MSALEAADNDLPEISTATFEKIDRWANVLSGTPIIDKPATFAAAAAELYSDALRETNIAAFKSIENDIEVIGCDCAELAPEIVGHIMDEALARAKVEGTTPQSFTQSRGDEPPPATIKDYGASVPATIDDTTAIVPATFITPAAWPDEAPPPLDWLIPGYIQRGDVTTLHGDGGAGKTDITLRLNANVARGAAEWLGLEIAPTAIGPVLFISAEDPQRKIWRRLWHHARHDGYDLNAVTNLHLWFPPKMSSTTLAVPDRFTGTMRPTAAFQALAAAIINLRPVLVAVDNVAATYGGNQNDRAQVRSFVNLWADIAEGPSKPAVLLLDHPSLSGLTNGTGRGGNMDWRNAVRSALHLHAPTDKAEADRGIRILETTKINEGKPGNPVRLVWAEGGLQREAELSSPHRAAKDAECEETFLRLLDERNAQGRHVSDKKSRNYAPAVFAEMQGSAGFTPKAFARAMDRLFEARTITLRPERSDGKTREVIDRANATPTVAS